MSTTVNPIPIMRAAEAPPQKPPADSGVGKVANQETFLKLLVAQIKNQNPMNPADGTQFVAQLAQFSELEQIIGVRAEIEQLRKELTSHV